MYSRERVLAALRREVPDRVPFVDLGAAPEFLARFLGKEMDIPGLANKGWEKEFSRAVGRDNIMSWDTGPATYYKHEVSSGGIPHYVDGLIKSRDDLNMVKLADPNRDELYEKAARFAEDKEDFAASAVMSMGVDPVVLGMGWDTFCLALYDDLALVEELLDIYTDWCAIAFSRLCRLGFDFMWPADDIAFKTGPFISPDVYREVFLPRLRKVAEAISIPWIYHSDGNLSPVLNDLLTLGMDGIHPLEPGAMDIAQVKKDYDDRICVVGNVLVDTLVAGTPAQVEAEVRQKIELLAPGGGYMISSSNSFPAECKVENVLAMGRAVRKYGDYVRHDEE